METAHDHGGTWIVVIGEIPEIRSALPSAIRDEGWQWHGFPTMDTFLATPSPPRTIVIPVIETFTNTALELIHDIATVLGLPVVVFGLEPHPMTVKAALDAGADDVISFPTSTEEIIARLRAIARVALPRDNVRSEPCTYRLDHINRSVSLDGGPAISLTSAEYRTFRALLAATDQPVTREQLIAQIAPFRSSRDTGLLDVTIGRLRRKLGAWRVQTIRGVGYQLMNEPQALQTRQPSNACG